MSTQKFATNTLHVGHGITKAKGSIRQQLSDAEQVTTRFAKSVGLEDIEDLKADLQTVFEKLTS